jgi:hypothetical protein
MASNNEAANTLFEFLAPSSGPLRARPITFKEVPATYYWLWVVIDSSSGTTLPQGWQEVTSFEEDTFLILCSQLGRIAVVTNEQGQTGRCFVRREDLEFAHRYPVLLAQQSPATVPPQEPAELLIGTHGVVLEGEAIRFCPLLNLGDAGKDVWERLQQEAALMIPPPPASRRTKQPPGKDIDAKDEHWELARMAAKQLAVLYWHLHEEMKKPPASLQRTLPTTTSVLRGKGIIIPQLDPVEGVLLALSHAQKETGGWREIDAIPTYTHQKSTSTTEVSVRPHEVQVVTGDITGQLWQRVRQFNDTDGDIFLAMLAQYLGTPSDTRGGTWITTQQILEYRGIQPKTHRKDRHKSGEVIHRRAGHRYEDMQDIAEGINRIRDTHITVRTWKESHKRKTTDKPTRRRIFQQESYLVTISDYIQQSQLLLPEEEPLPDAGLAVAWYYQPGTCIETFLVGPNYRASWLLQQALRYDPYHEQWEKRLARYFTFQMRMNADFGGTTIKRTIGTLINELALSMNTNDPGKTKERFEKAMNRLQEDGIISHWGPKERYEKAMKQRPRYNWIDTWLAYEVEVSADPLPWQHAQEIVEHLRERRKQQQALPQEIAEGSEEEGEIDTAGG